MPRHRITAVSVIRDQFGSRIPRQPPLEGKSAFRQVRLKAAWKVLQDYLHTNTTYEVLGSRMKPPVSRSRVQQLVDFAAREFLSSQKIDIEELRKAPRPAPAGVMSLETAIERYSAGPEPGSRKTKRSR